MPSERTYFILQLSKTYIEQVSLVQKTRQLKAMAELARENQSLLQLRHPCFLFENRWYTYPYNVDKTILSAVELKNNRTLHPDLREKAVEIMYPSFDEIVIYNKVRTLINEALNQCRTYSCIEKLLPKAITENVKLTDEVQTILEIGDPLSQKEIDDFKETNKARYDAYHQIVLTHLLLSTVDKQ